VIGYRFQRYSRAAFVAVHILVVHANFSRGEFYFLQDNEVRKEASRRGKSDLGRSATRQQLLCSLSQKRSALSN